MANKSQPQWFRHVPTYQQVLEQEWSLIKREYMEIYGHSLDNQYWYVKQRYYNDAKAKAKKTIQELRSFNNEG